jgi:hypothetical protein
MTPRTRNTNKEANFKVYYSKKVPQQVHFPHKRKTVRRPSELTKDGAEKRQLKFLPDKLRVRTKVEDSGHEEDEDGEEGEVAISVEAEDATDEATANRGKSARSRGKKRHSGAMEADSESDDEEAMGPTPKRRRKLAAPKSNRRSKQIKPEPEDDGEDNTTPAPTESKVDRSRTLRRQSTMTQLVEGRRPMSDTEDPVFKPVKRTSRRSWGDQDKTARDRKQRTLTQMIPGMKPLGIMSEDDMEEGLSDAEVEERESQLYGEEIAARLAKEGLMQTRSDDVKEVDNNTRVPIEVQPEDQDREGKAASLDVSSNNVPSLVVHSVEDSMDEEDGESYQPTQFIDAPSTRRRSPRKRFSVAQQASRTTGTSPVALRKKDKSRFSLLSTPEKRRVYEIASSQSPPDTPLSTQVSPSKAHRSPLKECSGNTAIAETPSRRKQVTFQEPEREPIPPPNLRKFESTIQDSEDEDDDDDLLETVDNASGSRVAEHTQALILGIDRAETGEPIGIETQAILDQIDQACLPADDDEGAWPTRQSSEEAIISIFQNQEEETQKPGELLHQDITPRQNSVGAHSPYRAAYVGIKYEGSPELGDETQYEENVQEENSPSVRSPRHTALAGVKQEQPHKLQMLDLSGTYVSLEADVLTLENNELASIDSELPEASEQLPSSPPIIQPRTEETCPSTPMVIMDSDEDSGSDNERDPTPPRPSARPVLAPPSTAPQHSADLNYEAIQVPRSPHMTQSSHSSKAELQLHAEWSSYSQYVGARAPQSSSMHVAPDKFSYHATPMPPRPETQLQNYMSQATTVDEVTPRKNRTQRRSANTTPRKVASSQPLSSPVKPPPLFIPSSFPSPSRARVEEWSSPVGMRTQDMFVGGSLEDFSIPLPPPVEDDWL